VLGTAAVLGTHVVAASPASATAQGCAIVGSAGVLTYEDCLTVTGDGLHVSGAQLRLYRPGPPGTIRLCGYKGQLWASRGGQTWVSGVQEQNSCTFDPLSWLDFTGINKDFDANTLFCGHTADESTGGNWHSSAPCIWIEP
jgi:hypothetical protein